MPNPDLHIVTFAVPYPPNYGGAIEVWNRLKALAAQGVKIKLHCFVYNQFLPQPELADVAAEVHYYPRTIWPVFFTKGQPFGVSSRKHKLLLERLRKDKTPILFESLQTTGWVKELGSRKKLLRAHNVEHRYYQQLAQHGKGFQGMIFNREAQCLEEYELNSIKDIDLIFSISRQDHQWFVEQGARSVHLSPFHGIVQVDTQPGSGTYALYQGDLSIEINQRAVLELVKMLPKDLHLPLIVAGRKGDSAFESKIASFTNLQRRSDVSASEMVGLIRNAHLIFIHSLHEEGMKMKVYPALFHGRHIMASQNSRTHSPLDDTIHFYQPETFSAMATALKHKPFDESALAVRKRIIAALPTDEDGAKEIINHL